MYKILLADDEFRVCKMLEKFINESGFDLKVVGIASNGKDAFDLISKETPDIVVTDIRMPIYDGVELARRTRALSNDCALIFISGYRQFEYAHSALSYGVKQYLLKPINKQDFLDTLANIIQSLDNKRNLSNPVSKQNSSIPQAVLGIRHSLLKALYTDRNINLSSIEDCNRRFLFSFKEGTFQTFIGILDSENISQDFLSQAVAGAMDSIINILNKFYAERLFEKEYYIIDNVIFWVANYKNERLCQKNDISKVFNEINQMLGRQGDLRLSLAVGPVTESIEELPQICALTEDAIKCRIRIGNGRIIFAEDLSYSDSAISPIPKENVIKCLEANDMECLLENISQLLAQSCSPSIHPKYKYDILFDFQRILEEYISRYSFLNAIDTAQLYKVILTENTEQRINASFMAVLSELLSNIRCAKQNVEMLPIKNAKEYMSFHIDEPLTLLDVASHVHLTPNYFSTLFKNETGCNYVDYLIALRIEKAKNLLLTDLPLHEVSKKVGYLDVKYFSKIFKKKVGIKPLDYRKFHD